MRSTTIIKFRMKAHRPEHLANAKAARQALEQLLDRMGWPADEMTFHRAIDRLLQIEEESR